MNFHTNHRLLVGFAALGYFALTYLIAIAPAYRVQHTPPLAAALSRTELAESGRALYLAEGCGFCHTQFVRDLPMDRPYGRQSLAEDYALENPPLLGTQRTGPDLANVAQRQPSDIWHLLHLYNPRTVVPQSVMPGYPWYFETKSKTEADPAMVIPVPDRFLPGPDELVVAKEEARALVAYLLSLKQAEAGL